MYPQLHRMYSSQVCVLLVLTFIGCVMALVTTVRVGLPIEKVYVWLGAAVLFMTPLLANGVALICLMLGRLFSVCVGFAASGMACFAAWNIPALKTSITAMPLSWAYWPVLLVVAVIFPVVLWLILAVHVLLGVGKRDPFDPF